jgi:tetratricopeptide (TPR) repeat protein
MAVTKAVTDEELHRLRVDAYVSFGRGHLQAGRYAEARLAFEQALAVEPGSRKALMGLGLALTRLGHYDEALATATKMFEGEVDCPTAYNVQAVCYHAMGREGDAEAAFEKSITYGPEFPGSHYNFACYWASRGDEDQCRQHLGRALELDPSLNVVAATDIDLKHFQGKPWFQELVAFKPHDSAHANN